MKKFLIKNNRLRQVLAVLAIALVLLVLFPSDSPTGQKLLTARPWVAAGYLILGIFFLFFNQIRLVFICMGCSAAISFYAYEAEMREYQLKITPVNHVVPTQPIQ